MAFPTLLEFESLLGGVRERRDSGESERLQKYEDLVDQDYDRFHHKCSKNIVFSTKRGLVATRRSRLVSGVMVYSAEPISVDRMFQVKLLEKEIQYGWCSLLSLVSACTK